MDKKEKYILKKQKKEQERLEKVKRGRMKKMFKVYLPALLIAAGVTLIIANFSFSRGSSNNNLDNQGAPKLEITSLEYDAGTVSMADGLVEHTYEIKNIGTGDLEIKDIRTSCMCTTAILRVNDKESPEFGMHNNPVFWSQIISPDETGFLDVIFDPAFHGPSGTGSAVRIVTFSTDDPDSKKAEVKLLANVIQ